jgi:hypothetical protein
VSDDEPYFPPPRKPQQQPAYRTPAARPPSETEPKRLVVTRPERLEAETAPPKLASTPPATRPPTYWEEHIVFARYPRPIGALLMLASGAIVWSTLDLLAHHGTYRSRGVVLAPVGVLVGLWTTVTGFPLGAEGNPPGWWVVGLVSCTCVGFIAGLLLLSILSG